MQINELDIGDYVTNTEGEYSQVRECFHGKKYYAYIGFEEDFDRISKLDSPVYSPSDLDEDLISDCCG